MEFGVGSILEGKVTGITKLGAFVSLPGGRSGLVHISEIAYSYVNDISEYLSEGQTVQVKVIGIDANNRINLSIKQTAPPPPKPERRPGLFRRLIAFVVTLALLPAVVCVVIMMVNGKMIPNGT